MGQGRLQDQIKMENKLKNTISDMPSFMRKYYLYLNEHTYMTKSKYINNVIRFLTFIGNGDINNITEEILSNLDGLNIQEYMESIQYKNEYEELKGSSKDAIYSSLNSFYSFMKRRKIIKENPFDEGEISRPKVILNDVVYLTPEEYSIVMANIMKGTGSQKARSTQKPYIYRDILLFRIPTMTGLRITALSQIRFDDIDFNEKTIRVVDKGKERTILLDDDTIDFIEIWKHKRQELLNGNPDDGFLFMSSHMKRMHCNSIRKVVKKYTTDIDKNITPHKLRATCATNLYNETGNIYLVSEMLGHESPATTKRYAQVSNEEKREAVNILANMMK